MLFKLLSGDLISIEFEGKEVSADAATLALTQFLKKPVVLLTEQQVLKTDELVTILIKDTPLVWKKFYRMNKLYRAAVNDYTKEPEEWNNLWEDSNDLYTTEDTHSFVDDVLSFIPLTHKKMALDKFLELVFVKPLPEELLQYFFDDVSEFNTAAEWQLKLKKTVKIL